MGPPDLQNTKFSLYTKNFIFRKAKVGTIMHNYQSYIQYIFRLTVMVYWLGRRHMVSIYLYICLSIYLSFLIQYIFRLTVMVYWLGQHMHNLIYPSVYLCIHLFVCQSIYQSIYLFVYLFVSFVQFNSYGLLVRSTSHGI